VRFMENFMENSLLCGIKSRTSDRKYWALVYGIFQGTLTLYVEEHTIRSTRSKQLSLVYQRATALGKRRSYSFFTTA
jgi:hypothetical protein